MPVRNPCGVVRLTAAFVCGLLVVQTLAAIPGADDPKAYTEHEYRRELLEFNRRTTAGAYERVGRRDPAWDEAALKMLEGVARHLTIAPAEPLYRLDDVPAPQRLKELEALGRAALAAGSDDPLVLDMFCVILNDLRKRDEIPPLVVQAARGFMDSPYPPSRACNSARRALRFLDRSADQAQYEAFEQMLYDTALVSLARDQVEGIDRRIVFDFIDDDLNAWPVEKLKRFYEDAQQIDTDPWLLNMVGGIYHIRAGWEARGMGVAHTVTPEGWQRLAEHLAQARACLTRAWELEPTYPEAATRMITVVMGGDQQPGETMRLWFDRAVQAQLDYQPAYTALTEGMLPRWQGSHAQMLGFGMECAATQRHDTRVPWHLVTILYRIRDDGGGLRLWSAPGVFERVEQVMRARPEQPRVGFERRFFYSQLAGFAWQVNRHADARRALDAIDGAYDPGGFAPTGTIASRTVSGIYALSGELAQPLLDAERKAAAGDRSAAAQEYARIAETLDRDNPAWLWVHGRRQEHAWRAAFDAGQWVSIEPSAELAGWYPIHGTWRVEGDALVGTADASGLRILCGEKFAPRVEYRGHMQIISEHPDRNAGPIVGYAAGFRFCGLWAYPHDGRVWFQVSPTRPGYGGRDMADVNSFRIRFGGGLVAAYINEGAVVPQRALPAFAQGAETLIGLGSDSPHPGMEVRFTALEVRRVDDW